MNDIYSQILNILSENKFVSAKDIAFQCQCSDKTIRTRIKELNNDLKGAKIISKPRYGYCLEITKQLEYEEYKKRSQIVFPNHSKDRIDFLMRLLLSTNQYYKLEDLSSMLYVSSKTLSMDLHKLERIISKYDLKIKRKPNYGIKVIGSEFNFRLCLSSLMFKNDKNDEVAEKLNAVDGYALRDPAHTWTSSSFIYLENKYNKMQK